MFKSRSNHVHLAIFSLIAVTFFTSSYGADFNVVNQCTYTVWAAASPGGGQRLDPGQSWSLTVAAGTTGGRIWGRTNCSFDANGQGQCDSGNCNGGLVCLGYGQPPNTLVEFSLNQFNNLDFFDISLIDGFNIPVDFSPTTNVCRGIQCAADINSQCPAELKAPGGCNNPCTAFKTNKYCCTQGSCGPTTYSEISKNSCPDAYSYPQDDATSTFTCPSGTNYKVTFCPKSHLVIANQCSYTVWAAALPFGGERLDPGQDWSIGIPQSINTARIWGRTNCKFDVNGPCDSGNCVGGLSCQTNGTPPYTLMEFAFNKSDNLDHSKISLADGFNMPVDLSPTTDVCKGIRCAADIISQCPVELKAPGGCNNPCAVFDTSENCCNDSDCGPTTYSKFFKYLCPDAYNYAQGNTTSTYTCPTGTNYKVTFCP